MMSARIKFSVRVDRVGADHPNGKGVLEDEEVLWESFLLSDKVGSIVEYLSGHFYGERNFVLTNVMGLEMPTDVGWTVLQIVESMQRVNRDERSEWDDSRNVLRVYPTGTGMRVCTGRSGPGHIPDDMVVR